MTKWSDRLQFETQVEKAEDGCSVNHVCTLTGHSKTINCVRVSPTGRYMVSSGDGGEVLLWQPIEGPANTQLGNLVALDENGTPQWKRSTVLRGHTDDVMDACWAADGSALLTGSIDNKAIVFDLSDKKRGQPLIQLSNHKHFVQGVAWDPAQQFLVTQSADRTCRIWSLKPPAAGKRKRISQWNLPACETAKDFYCSHTLAKRAMSENGKVDRHPLFHDESVSSFFRRLSWSPDGSFLVVPTGIFRCSQTSKDVNTAYVYARGRWAAPVMHLPGHGKPVVAVKFCPVLYEKSSEHSHDHQPFSALPYKMVFAVATLDSVILYDTESVLPLCVLGAMHYDSITDIGWSCDGRYLVIASRDCFCSLVCFDEGDFGKPLRMEQLPEHIVRRVLSAQKKVEPLTSQTGNPVSKKGVVGDQPLRKPEPVNTVHSTVEKVQRVQEQITSAVVGAEHLTTPASQSNSGGAGSKRSRRITPTLLSPAEFSCDEFSAHIREAQLPGEVSRDATHIEKGDGVEKKRITPVPVVLDPLGFGGIAALAMQAGQQAAKDD